LLYFLNFIDHLSIRILILITQILTKFFLYSFLGVVMNRNNEISNAFKAIFSNIPLIIYKIDKNGSYTYSYGAGLRKQGLQDNQLVGVNVFEERPHLKDYIIQALNGKIVQFIDKYSHEGKIVYFQNYLFPDKATENGVVGFSIEITEHKQIETELRQSKSELDIRNKIASIFLTVSDEGMYGEVLQVVLKASKSRFGVFGYIDEDRALVVPSMTRHIWDKCRVPDKSIIFPHDTWKNSIWVRAIKEKKPLYSNEISSKTPKGHIQIFRNVATPIIHQGEVIGILHVANKESDYGAKDVQLLETIANYIAPVLNARLQRDRQERARNQAEEKLRKAHFELERRVEERTVELKIINEQLQQEIQERIRVEQTVKEAYNELELKVEERTKELSRANLRLKELDKLKSMFIASMSHELRTPLNSIIGFTGIILQGMSGEINDEVRKQLTMVKNSANHLLALINDVIDVSKIEAGMVDLYIEEFDLSAFLQEVKDSFKIALEKKGIDIIIKKSGALRIESDKRRVKQIIMNLVSNAIKFTETGVIEIETILNNTKIKVSVTDTGIGIKDTDMYKLFKAFSQIHINGRINDGTGLGLYLSKKIAELLNGDILVESEFRKGSKFTLILPLKYEGDMK